MFPLGDNKREGSLLFSDKNKSHYILNFKCSWYSIKKTWMHLPRNNKITTVTLASCSRTPESSQEDLQTLTPQETGAWEELNMQRSHRTLTTAREDEGLRGVHCNAPDVVGMGLEHVNSFQGVVIKNSDLHVILEKAEKATWKEISCAVHLLCNAGELGKNIPPLKTTKCLGFFLANDTNYTWIQKAINYTLLFQVIYELEKTSTKFSFLQVTESWQHMVMKLKYIVTLGTGQKTRK